MFAILKKMIATHRAESKFLDVAEELRKIAEKVGVGITSIERQYRTWPTRTRNYRRRMTRTKLLSSEGRCRRVAWTIFLAGAWHHCRSDGETETFLLKPNADSLSITWMAHGCKPRDLDWSWGGHKNMFTLVGGDTNVKIR